MFEIHSSVFVYNNICQYCPCK